MTAADRGEPPPDYYRLLGVTRGASREEVAQAWRRRARAEHPDRRPGEAGQAARFGAVAEAYHVLGDPNRRAAYDRAFDRGQAAAAMPPGVPVPVRVIRPGDTAGAAPMPGPPLRAGPVRAEDPFGAAGGSPGEDEVRLAVAAALALGYLRAKRDRTGQERDRPW
jgi:curved DNA-binding protein CbpA